MLHLDEERITALLDNELSPAEAEQARDHLKLCVECASRFEEAKGFFEEADRLVRVLEFPEVVAPVQPAAALTVEAKTVRRRFPLRPLAWAASLFLAIGLGYYGNELRVSRNTARIDPAQAPSTKAPAADAAADALTEARSTAAPTPAVHQPANAPAEQSHGKDLARRQAEPAGAPAATNEKSLDKEKVEDERRLQSDGAVTGQLAAAPPVQAESQPAAATAPMALRDAKPGAAGGRADSAAGSKLSANAMGLAAKAPPQRSESGQTATKVTLEEAVWTLGGSIRLIDGLTPDRVERLSGRAVPGAQPDLAIIRVIYLDAPMRELWLDQQRGKGVNPTADTVLLHGPDGGLSLQWPNGPDGWLSLSGHLTADSLRILARRVR
jgi:hypothetical protein